MAQNGRKKTGKPVSAKKSGQKEKKPFWSYFFEPVPEDEDQDFFEDDFDDGFDLDRQYGEPPEPASAESLFNENELDFSDAEDVAAVAQLTWSNGERVITDAAYPPEVDPGAYAAYPYGNVPQQDKPSFGSFQPSYIPPVQTNANPYVPLTQTSQEPYVPLQTGGSPYVPLHAGGNPYAPVQAGENPYAPLNVPQQPAVNPYVPLQTSGNPFVPLQTEGNPYVPLQAGGNPYVPLQAGENPYAPVTEPIQASADPYAPSGAPFGAPTQPDPGFSQQPYYVPGQAPYGGAYPPTGLQTGFGGTSAGEQEYGDIEEINLFDAVEDGDSVSAGERGQTTRLFRTGTGATTRIHINETEDAIRMEEAAKRARARAAKQKHDAEMERRNKRKKQAALMRKIFANIAFVLFFIIAVLVALYYGFLLSDIVVLGNDTYSSDYIIQLSGLEKGTHMLFCDLDQAAEDIRQDPYIEVSQINYIFPNRVRIVINERKQVAGITGLDYNVIIDDKGYVLSMSGGTDISGLLQVSGVSTTGFQIGQQLGEGNDLGTATLVQIIGKLEEYGLMSSVKSIDMSTPLAITFRASNGLNVHLGQSTDLDNKLSTFARLYPQFVSQNIYEGTLYLSAKGGAVYSPPNAAANAAAAAGDVPPEEDTPLPEDQIPPDDQGVVDPTSGAGGDPSTPTSTPKPTPTPYKPGGTDDDFQG